MAEAELGIVMRARDDATAGIDTVEKRVSGFGKASQIAGAAVGASAAIMTGALASAAQEASRFEAGMREVNSLINLSESEFKELSQQTRELSERMGVDAVQSSKALYQAISAGVPKENAMEFLEIASKAAIGGVTDTETAVDGLTTVLNAFKMDASETGKVADIMFTTVKQGKTTMGELSRSLFNVAPIAASAGVRFDEVAASIATLTKQGTPTSVATTQIRAAIQAIIKPTDEMAIAMGNVGYELAQNGEISGPMVDRLVEINAAMLKVDNTTKEGQKQMKDLNKQFAETAAALGPSIIEAKGLNTTLEMLSAVADGNTNTLGKMFGSVEGLSAVLGTTGANASMFAGDLEAINDAGGSSVKAFDEMNKSSKRWGDMIKAKMQSASIAVGDFLGPTQGMIAMLPGLSAGFSAAGGAMGLLTSAMHLNIGAMVLHKAASIASTVAQGAMTAAQWALNAALTANPIGLVVAALAALTAGVIWAYQNVDWFREIADNAFALLKTAGVAAANAAGAAIDGLVGIVRGAIEAVGNLIDLLGQLPGMQGLGDLLGGIKGQPAGPPGSIYGYASGGVVPGPRGAAQLAVVHGGETITPPGMGGGNIYITVQGTVISERDLGRVVREELLRVGRRTVTGGILA